MLVGIKKVSELFWRWKSRPKNPGRPRINHEIRNLIHKMAITNPLVGCAPRIHGELLKLGIEISERTVSKNTVFRDVEILRLIMWDTGQYGRVFDCQSKSHGFAWMNLLRHEDIRMTQRHSHHCPESLRDGVEILEVDYKMTTIDFHVFEKTIKTHLFFIELYG